MVVGIGGTFKKQKQCLKSALPLSSLTVFKHSFSIHHLTRRKVAQAFLITSCSIGFLREQNEPVSGADCVFKGFIPVGESVKKSSLTAHMSAALQEGERQQDRLIDADVRVEWITAMQLYSSSKLWVWCLMERNTLRRCGNDSS